MSESPAVFFLSDSSEQTTSLGAALARAAVKSSRLTPLVIALNGELGAGKTVFVGGFLRALGLSGPARSPTYTLIESYEFPELAVHHLDLYRIGEPRDLDMLALRDLLNPGHALLVEWAERGGVNLPTADLSINMRYANADSTEQRQIVFRGHTASGNELAASAQDA